MIRAEPDSDKQLRSIVERIERVFEEIDDLKTGIKEIYLEAKSNGFDKTALGQVVNYRRKLAKNEAKVQETEALFDMYLAALGMAVATHTHEKPSPAPKPKLVAVEAAPVEPPAPKPPLVMPEIPAFLDRRSGVS